MRASRLACLYPSHRLSTAIRLNSHFSKAALLIIVNQYAIFWKRLCQHLVDTALEKSTTGLAMLQSNLRSWTPLGEEEAPTQILANVECMAQLHGATGPFGLSENSVIFVIWPGCAAACGTRWEKAARADVLSLVQIDRTRFPRRTRRALGAPPLARLAGPGLHIEDRVPSARLGSWRSAAARARRIATGLADVSAIVKVCMAGWFPGKRTTLATRRIFASLTQECAVLGKAALSSVSENHTQKDRIIGRPRQQLLAAIALFRILKQRDRVLLCDTADAGHAGCGAVSVPLELFLTVEGGEQPVTATRKAFMALLRLEVSFALQAGKTFARPIFPALAFFLAKLELSLERSTSLTKHEPSANRHASLNLAGRTE